MPNSPDRAAPFGISPQKLLALKKLPLLLAVLLGLLAFWTGCANQGSGPDGGPYDETPPHIVSMSAPEKVGRNKKVKFSLTFNELIKVDNPSEKIIVSPPQIEQPEIKVSGRKITVELLDSMIPNTTYTVDFSDAITDNNEGNPLGQYTYIFSTGVTTDTMQMSGHILNAEDLEPVKGILAGLHFDASDTAFTRKPFDRVARTDADGYFSIKGVNAQRNYRIYALQDADGDFRYTQPTELIGWLNTPLTASSRPDVRYDTAWVDSTRYDSIRTIHFTHFLPDDIVVRAFKVDYRPRHFLKYTRDVPEWFTLFFTGPSRQRPQLRGLNFDAARSLFPIANRDNDTLTYWLTDTTLLHLDTLRLACTYDDWDDSLKVARSKTDTLEITPKTTFAKRLVAKQKELAKWEKQRERRHKRGDFTDETPPREYLEPKISSGSPLTPDRNVTITFPEPLAQLRAAGVHLRLKEDTLWHDAPFALDSVPGNPLAATLRAEWRPAQHYKFVIDSAAVRSIYGLVNKRTERNFEIAKLEDFGTVFVTLHHADTSAVVQLLNTSGNVEKEVHIREGRAEFYYVRPGNYYLRCYLDRNNDGRWTTGDWITHTEPEPVYYSPKEIEVKANWDLNEDWDVTALPLDKQKPAKLIKQKGSKSVVNMHQRNLERLRKRGE